MSNKVIKIETDFTWAPAGRYREFGPYTGEVFRVDLLVPALQKYDSVTVDLDGAIGYGSSFVEETFGGLVREHGYSENELKETLKIKTEEFHSIEQEIWLHISEAETVAKAK